MFGHLERHRIRDANPGDTAAWQEAVRRLAVARVREGYAPGEVADFLGVSYPSVKRWAAAYRDGGDAALAARPHPGPAPKLTPRQAERGPGGGGGRGPPAPGHQEENRPPQRRPLGRPAGGGAAGGRPGGPRGGRGVG